MPTPREAAALDGSDRQMNQRGAAKSHGRYRTARRWRWRWRRAAPAGGGTLLLLVATAVYGWRYGFSPLPTPVPGWQYTRLPSSSYYGQVLSRAAQGQPEEALAWSRSLQEQLVQRSRVRTRFDRPAGWALARWGLTDPQVADQRVRAARATLEIWRLALALRLYRDEHARWPATLDELVPDPLRSLPPDLLGDGPFRYALRGEHWVPWSAGATGLSVDQLERVLAGRRPLPSTGLVCTSNEAGLAQRGLKAEQARLTGAWMTPQMMQRYGLAPRNP